MQIRYVYIEDIKHILRTGLLKPCPNKIKTNRKYGKYRKHLEWTYRVR